MAASTIAGRPHTPTKLDNSSYRVEYFDEGGQRTDVKTAYIETASSLQRWFSAEVEIRPGVTTRRSMQMHRKGSSSFQIVPNRNFVRYGCRDAA